MPDYSSFTTTPNKVLSVYNGLQNVQQQIIDLPALQATFRSNTQISNRLQAIPILTRYEVDTGAYLQFTFPNITPEIATSINFIPIFYSDTLLDTTTSIGSTFNQIWEIQDDNIVVSLEVEATLTNVNERHQQATLSSFMDLYLVFSNNGLYYNV